MSQTAKPNASAPLHLSVIDREGVEVGKIPCRPGLQTYAGVVTRNTDKTVWTQGSSGSEVMHRKYDGNLPSIYKSYAPVSEVTWKTEQSPAKA